MATKLNESVSAFITGRRCFFASHWIGPYRCCTHNTSGIPFLVKTMMAMTVRTRGPKVSSMLSDVPLPQFQPLRMYKEAPSSIGSKLGGGSTVLQRAARACSVVRINSRTVVLSVSSWRMGTAQEAMQVSSPGCYIAVYGLCLFLPMTICGQNWQVLVLPRRHCRVADLTLIGLVDVVVRAIIWSN